MATDEVKATEAQSATQPAPERKREPAATLPQAAPTRSWVALALIGLLCAMLGFALAVQLRTVDSDQGLAGAREEDLARILADLESRQDRLRSEISEQQDLLEQLGSGEDSAAAAVEEARRQAEALAILNGTIPAVGPGLTITIRDPDSQVDSAILLDAVQELRGAGAETMQVAGVRIGVSSALVGEAGDVRIDGIEDGQFRTAQQLVGEDDEVALGKPCARWNHKRLGNRPGRVADPVRQAIVPRVAQFIEMDTRYGEFVTPRGITCDEDRLKIDAQTRETEDVEAT